MRRVVLILALIPILSISCATYPDYSPRQIARQARWDNYVPKLKRISVDILTRAAEVKIVDKESLTRIAEAEFTRLGIEVVDHTTMVTNPQKGDGIYFFQVSRYRGPNHVFLLLWSRIPNAEESELYHWGYTSPLIFLETNPVHITDEDLREQYRSLVKSTARSVAETIIKAR